MKIILALGGCLFAAVTTAMVGCTIVIIATQIAQIKKEFFWGQSGIRLFC